MAAFNDTMQQNFRTGLLTSTTFRGFSRRKFFVPRIIVLAVKPVDFDCGIELAMEHYRKKRIRFYEAEALPNEIKVANSGRTQEIASKAARKLKEAGPDGIVISSSGPAVSKAVTVVELLKRRIPNLIQDTQIKYTRVEDIWEPDTEDLDVLKVVRKTPTIVVTLRTTSSDDQVIKETTSEASSLPTDATIGTTTSSSCSSSSAVQKMAEGTSAPTVMDSAAPEKTPGATSKRTKKSKSSRKST